MPRAHTHQVLETLPCTLHGSLVLLGILGLLCLFGLRLEGLHERLVEGVVSLLMLLVVLLGAAHTGLLAGSHGLLLGAALLALLPPQGPLLRTGWVEFAH